MRAILLLLAVVGCGRLGFDETGGDEDAPEVSTDDPAEAVDIDTDPACPGTLLPICEDVPASSIALSGTLDTDGDARCVSISQTCAVLADSIAVGSLRVTGSRPLVLVAAGPITISGVLDVSSDAVGVGAGADFAGCTMPSGAQHDSGAGGGAGGSFGGIGGRGGDGNASGGQGLGAVAAPAVTPVTLRGGCAGGNGGDGGNGGTVGAIGGRSGGAVYVLAGDSITVTGEIRASGAGGEATQSDSRGCGGGGGGSGGMIALEAPIVDISGELAANGGGGGEGGGSDNAGRAGGRSTRFDAKATGGGGDSSGGRGGDGAATTSAAQAGAEGEDTTSGGGGGGGGGGVVWISGDLIGGLQISPDPL